MKVTVVGTTFCSKRNFKSSGPMSRIRPFTSRPTPQW